MAGFIQVPADGAGKRVDTVTLTDATVEVHRQKMVVTGGSGTAEVVVVTNAAPAGTDMGLVVRHAGTATVAGTVNVNGGVAVSGTAVVAGVVGLTAGVANIGFINNISATVTVAGVVGLTAGTAVIGDLNAISRTVQVAVATPFTLNNISATVTVAGNVNISTMPAVTFAAGQVINNISATVTIAGIVGLTAGTANIGNLDFISRTVQVAIATPFTVNNISASVAIATGASFDFNTLASADQVQNVAIFGIALPASGGASVGGTNANPLWVNVNAFSQTASVVLAAGVANIGIVNNISATVTVAGNVNISTMPAITIAAGQIINNISATVTVAGSVVISSTATIAGNVNISATANVSSVIRTSTGTAVEDTVNNALRVNVVAGSAGGPSVNDNTTFTAGAGGAALNPIGGLLDDVAPVSASEGAAGILRMTPLRALHVSPRLSTGTAMEDTANTALRVNVVAGGGAGGGTSTADRSTFTPGTTAGTPAQGTYNTTAAVISDGEAATVRITNARAFHVSLYTISGTAINSVTPLSVKVENTSATASVVIAAGVANIGTINNISATVTVAGSVVISSTATVAGVVGLTAGTANIGSINDISRTVQVAVGTPFTINNISASVVIATGASFDFNTLASADQVQNVAIFGIALPASGGASVGGTNSNPLWVNVNTVSGTAAVALAAGTANFGTLNDISRTVQVAIATPFTIQGISTTVTVAGVISLGAGANVIGTINNISATTIVAGVVSLGAGTNNIGFINNISATVTVAGNVVISSTATIAGVVGLTAGTQNIGFINNISATVTVVVAGYSPAIMSVSRGPKCVTASTSAVVELIASPGVGANIFVTRLMVGNFSSTLTRARIGTSASASTIVQPLAASGGGFVLDFDPPWMLSASERCVCSVKPNVADAFFNVMFFVK